MRICYWSSYVCSSDLVEESARTLDTATDLPKQPVIFSKPPTTVIGPGQPVVHRADITQQLDWEVELAVVIGTAASRVAREDALKHVFGYTACIAMSALDCRRAGQWIYSTGQDRYAPMRPCISTAAELARNSVVSGKSGRVIVPVSC